MSTATYWDLAVYIGPAAFIACAAPLLFLAWRTHRKGKRFAAMRAKYGDVEHYMWSAADRREFFNFDEPRAYRIVTALIVVGIALSGIGVAFAYYPWRAEFWQWRSVSGEVESIESRFTGTGDGTSQEYVAVIDGIARRLTDPRAAMLAPGDHVDLMCKQSWQYGAASINVCRWGGEVVNR